MTNPIETLQALVDALFESHPAVAVSGTEAQESKHYAALTDGREWLAQLKAQPSDDLHEAILNLPITRLRNQITDWRNGYKEGHKDARHAAAELVLAHQGAQPAVPDAATKGWLAALSDARYAARGNEWLVSKLAEIHVHLAAAPSASAQPQGIDMKLLQEIEGEFVRLEHLPAFIRRLQDRLRAALAASAQEPQGEAQQGAQEPAVPAGFKLVPVEPTPEMVAAGSLNKATGRTEEDGCVYWRVGMIGALDTYCEMLAAAPSASDAPCVYGYPKLCDQCHPFGKCRDRPAQAAQGEAQQPESREPLTEEQIREAVTAVGLGFTAPDIQVARAVEAMHGIGSKP